MTHPGIYRTRGFARCAVSVLVVAASVLVAAQSAFADLKLRLTAGLDQVTITDEGIGDACALVGCVTFNGPLADFFLNVSSGISSSSPTLSSLSLTSVHLSALPGTVFIELTDTDFPATGAGEFHAEVSGTAGGSVTLSAHKNASNLEFDASSAIALSFGPLAGALSTSDSTSHDALASYSMTLKATVTHSAGTETTVVQFTATNSTGPTPTPEPSALVLLGMGLVTVGAIVRRRKRI